MFPFSAIVGQEELKLALMVSAVNPQVGGLLISGDKGTAKSTAVRGLAELLPEIEVADNCRFNCAPGNNTYQECTDCSVETQVSISRQAPFIDLPLGATEDRVLGSLDFESALKSGTKAFQAGLLASAHRGILYIDEVNLLHDHLVDVLLDVAASGINKVERESMTLSHPSSFTLIGSMNPEEGELRPQFLDRFAMMVTVRAPEDPDTRAEVLRRRIDFDTDKATFKRIWDSEQNRLRNDIEKARRILPSVTCSDEQLQLISRICAELAIKSLRADIFVHKVSTTIAALGGRTEINEADIKAACSLVLKHRVPKSNKRSEPEQDLKQKLEELLQEPEQEPSDENDSDSESSGSSQEQVISAAMPQSISKIETQSTKTGSTGKRSTTLETPRGLAVRTTDSPNSGIAIDATIRTSVIRSGGQLAVEKSDLRYKSRQGKSGNLIILVVDASGSMAAMQRMKLVKGTALSLLQDAYQRRDQVAVITFRGTQAEVALPPTRSTTQAEQRLADLPTGGTTPLASALESTLQVVESNSHSQLQPLVILLTDGRANAGTTDSDPWEEALTIAGAFAERQIPTLVLDTEVGAVRLQRARLLAERMESEYMPLESLSADDLKRVIIGKAGRAIGKA